MFNHHAVWAIYKFEMARFMRTAVQSVLTPVLTTSLYFIVFGSAIGSRMDTIDGVSYGAFIVPGLIMLSLFTEGLSNASFGIYVQKFTGTIYELLSAPISASELVLAFVGAAVTKSLLLGALILATAALFVPLQILQPGWMVAFLSLTAITFCLFGFVLGVWAKGWEQLSMIPFLIVTPLTFLGGAFYSIDMLPVFWQKVSLVNPILYMVNAFRYGLLGVSDIDITTAFSVIVLFCVVLFAVSLWLLERGVGLRT